MDEDYPYSENIPPGLDHYTIQFLLFGVIVLFISAFLRHKYSKKDHPAKKLDVLITGFYLYTIGGGIMYILGVDRNSKVSMCIALFIISLVLSFYHNRKDKKSPFE